VNRGGEGAIDNNTQKLKNSTATCGPGFYRSELLGKDVLGNVFIPEPAGNLVKRFLVNEKDGMVTAENVVKGTEFLASTDERFRPVNCYTGPDGALYIVDLYRGILQHKAFLTAYLKDNIAERKLSTPVNMGRIWRVVPENAKGPIAAAKLPKESAAIVPFLGHENGWVRDTAQRLLVERQDKTVVPAIMALAKTTTPLGKIHAMWTLEGLNSLSGAVTGPLMKDPDPKVRATAVRLADKASAAEAAKLANDPSMDVKFALAFTAGSFPETMAAIPALLNASNGNAIVRTAISSGLRNRELEALEAMLSSGQPVPEAMASDLAAAVMSEQKTARVKHLLTLIAAQPANSPAQSAMLAGIGKSGGRGNKLFYLDAQPPEFAKLATTLDAKNKALLGTMEARFGWPNKPGMPPPPVVTPLSPAEQKLFDLGKTTFAICAACHQPNGRGQDGLAPALVDSEFVLGNPDIVPRIVMHGIGGPLKVNGQNWALDMPPLGAALTDEQIAAVATYLRREWEHNASPVSVADVAKIRAETKSRTKSWTADELGMGGGKDGGRKRGGNNNPPPPEKD
jgi:mono/diheme cytochrome c family protein